MNKIQRFNAFNQCDQIWYIFYQIQLDGLGHPPCFKDLQHSEQEGVFPPNLSNFGKRLYIYGHTAFNGLRPERFKGLHRKSGSASK